MRFICVNSQDLATILDPFRVIFGDLETRPPICDLNIVILGQLRLLRFQQCDIGTVETSETSTLCVETRQMSVLATEEMSAAQTGQMSAVEAGQMSAVETRQMSSAETKQMSTGKTGRCPVPLLYICLVSAEDIYPVSAKDITAAGRRPAAAPSFVETG